MTLSASDLQPGDYVVLRTGSPFGYLVRTFTRSPFDHAVLYCGHGVIVEATIHGAKIDSLSLYAGALAAANTGETLTAAQRAAIVAKARSFAGLEYGWGAIVTIALRLLGFRWGWLQRIADDKDALICSELVAKSGDAAGVNWLCGEQDPAFVTPAELSRCPGVVPVSI